MRIVFMGTPDFAVESLKALIENGHEIVGVFTQPDKPKGRKRVLTAPPVKEMALSKSIDVYQPNSLKNDESVELIKSLNPEIIVVVAYGKILPKAVLDIPQYGCVNVHGSLLPKYRGAAPIQWAVLNGDKEAGVTTMLMDVGLDTGDMLLKDSIEIGENENYGELFERLAVVGGKLLVKTLDLLVENKIVPEKQDESLSTYAQMLDRTMSPIDWLKSAQEVHNKVRGLCPWPIASTIYSGEILKIYSTLITDNCGKAGEVIESGKKLVIACGEKSVEVIELQYASGKRMKAQDFLRGRQIPVGTILGE